jgi:cell wall-associated NlpC family hydrolase
VRLHQLGQVVRTALAVLVVAVAAALMPAASMAQPTPPPGDGSTARQRYEALAQEAGKADEDLLEAKSDLKSKRAQLDGFNAELVQAKQAEDQAKAGVSELREQVDRLARASFQGARFNQMSALLVSDSPQEFLDKMSALEWLALDNKIALEKSTAASVRAQEARERTERAQRGAQEAADAAARLTAEVEQRKRTLDRQIAQLQQALNAMSSRERADLGRVRDTGSYMGPPGAANTALQAALSRRGSAYVWAAEGPNTFDCSGLTMWAYKQAGISLPHSSREQYKLGRAVSRDQLQPGDLVFYDDGTGNPARIHHVGMYVGNGKMVDAPTQGQVVDVRSIQGDGHYIGARRIVG